MREKRNLSYLVDTIANQTKLDPKTVRLFLTHFFKGMEREITDSSVVKINDLGIFRIIKSLSGDRILFLGKFQSANSVNTTDGSSYPEKVGVSPVSSLIDENDITEKDIRKTNGPATNEINIPDCNSINDHIELHKDKTEFTGFGADKFAEEEWEKEDKIDDESYFYDYENDSRKKNRISHIKLGIISAILLVGVLGFIYFNYTPKQNDIPRHNYFAEYSEIENTDTSRFLRIIEAESNIDFLILAKKYYTSEIFWPYIYQANQESVPDSFIIKTGTVIKIPKIDKNLIDLSNEQSIDIAKRLAYEIINMQNSHGKGSRGFYIQDSIILSQPDTVSRLSRGI